MLTARILGQSQAQKGRKAEGFMHHIQKTAARSDVKLHVRIESKYGVYEKFSTSHCLLDIKCKMINTRKDGKNHIVQVSVPSPLRLQLFSRYIFQVLSNNGVRHLPDLQQVVLRSGTKYPWVAEVPVEVGDTVGVTTVHEQAASYSGQLTASKYNE